MELRSSSIRCVDTALCVSMFITLNKPHGYTHTHTHMEKKKRGTSLHCSHHSHCLVCFQIRFIYTKQLYRNQDVAVYPRGDRGDGRGERDDNRGDDSGDRAHGRDDRRDRGDDIGDERGDRGDDRGEARGERDDRR